MVVDIDQDEIGNRGPGGKKDWSKLDNWTQPAMLALAFSVKAVINVFAGTDNVDWLTILSPTCSVNVLYWSSGTMVSYNRKRKKKV